MSTYGIWPRIRHLKLKGWTAQKKNHLFDVEDKEVLDSTDGREDWTVERADPADGLTVDDLQHILGNSKLLLAPPLDQAPVTVLHDQPEQDSVTEGHF